MNASEYLKFLQGYEKYYHRFLAFVPKNGGGTDLDKLPLELQRQFSYIGVPIDKTSYHKWLEESDWAKNAYSMIYDSLPEQMKQTLKVGEDFAIGSVHSSEFNGAALLAEDGKGIVIILPVGAMLFLNNVATQITIHASEELCRTIISGALDRCGIEESFFLRIRRRMSNLNRGIIQKQFPFLEAAEEFDYLMQGYFDLGVTIPVNIIRKYQPVPLIGNPLRVGHPLECGAYLEYFSYQFLLLHEFAHVMLNHIRSHAPTEEIKRSQEFAADNLAFKTAIDVSKTENWKIASCIGTWVFLLTAKWLERLETNHQNDSMNTHPPADKRLEALRNTLVENSLVDKKVFKFLEEIESLFENYWLESEYIRNLTKGFNHLTNLLIACVHENTQERFKDVIPRWLMFGAPLKVCHELARLRLELEDILVENPDASFIRERLNLVMWVYESAADYDDSSLIKELDDQYSELIKNGGKILNGS